MNIRTCLLLSVVSCSLLAVARGQLISVALEQHNRQTGEATTSLNEYVFYATIEDVAGATGGTVSANSGVLTTPASVPDDGDFYEYRATRTTLSGLTADFPLSANYTVAVAGSPAGDVGINGPGGTFANHNPASVLFTISGVTGTWSGSTFYFNPVGVTSFTVTINNYSATNPGGHYGWYFGVADITSGYSELGEVGAGPVTDATAFSAPTFTFTNGAALNGGDTDDSTYGFTTGTRMDLEAGFFNGIGLTDSGLGDGSEKTFVVGNVTGFTLAAIPEPSTYAAIFGALASVGVAIRRRRRLV